MEQFPDKPIPPLNYFFSVKRLFGYKNGWWLHTFINTSPRLFYTMLNLLGRNHDGTITADTALVVAAIGGCANTYSADAARLNLPDRHIASHQHSPVLVLQARRVGAPCLVLIRHPIDAMTSVYSRGGYDSAPGMIAWAFKDYCFFYDTIIDIPDAYVAAKFEQVTSDYVAVMDRVNEKFGTNYVVPPNGSAEAEPIRHKNKWQEQNRQVSKQVVRDHLMSEQWKPLRLKAEASYERFCKARGLPL